MTDSWKLTPASLQWLVAMGLVVPARRSRLKPLLAVPTAPAERVTAGDGWRALGVGVAGKAPKVEGIARLAALTALARPEAELVAEEKRPGEADVLHHFVIGAAHVVRVAFEQGEVLAVGPALPREGAAEAIAAGFDVSSPPGLEPVPLHPEQLQALAVVWSQRADGGPLTPAQAEAAATKAGLPAADARALVEALTASKVVAREGETLVLPPPVKQVLEAVWSGHLLSFVYRETPDDDVHESVLDVTQDLVQVVGPPGGRLGITNVDADDLEEEGLAGAHGDELLVFSRINTRVLSESLTDFLAD